QRRQLHSFLHDALPISMQAGNPLAQRSKIDPHIGTHPSMGAVAARFRGPNDPALPAFVGMADLNLFFADVLGASPMGGAYEAARSEEHTSELQSLAYLV